MTFDRRQSIGNGLHHLAQRLGPIISAQLATTLQGLPWTTVLDELDRGHGKAGRTHSADDVQSHLRIITERLGGLGYPFDNRERAVSTLGNELRIVRNNWAHFKEFTTLDVWRAHDTVVRLLTHLEDPEGSRHATTLRDEAFAVLVQETGLSTPPTPHLAVTEPAAEAADTDQTEAEPDQSVLTRDDSTATPTIGADRFPFEPWALVRMGDIDVIDALPKKAAKAEVRAVAAEIAEFEGPIHLDRLARLTVASFGMKRLEQTRKRQITHQIKQTGLDVDKDKFVWPTDLDPEVWTEFRPEVGPHIRPFNEISPVEIANAARLLEAKGVTGEELTRRVLQTFGRKRRTKAVITHLRKAGVQV